MQHKLLAQDAADACETCLERGVEFAVERSS
jgi:hypothetical protein